MQAQGQHQGNGANEANGETAHGIRQIADSRQHTADSRWKEVGGRW
jgi:hypothetical protein